MRIGLDISQIVYETGVSTYVRNLVVNLLRHDKQNAYVLWGGSLRRKDQLLAFLSELKGNFEKKILNFPPSLADFVWNRLHILKIESLIGGIDVFHSSDWVQPPSDAKKVTTVHDLVPLKYPKLSLPKIVDVHRRRFKHIKREVDIVIVPSQTSKADLIELGIEEERLRVVPEAPDPIYKPVGRAKISELKKKYRIAGEYILSVGVTPRKNTERIIEAFEKFRPGRGLKLVIVGEPKFQLKQKRNVIFTGHVPAVEMPIFYSGAEVLVYPSLYEGFGLPILEAFSCKTPVVTSNFGSMAEVAGKAAVLVDPYEVDSIKDGIGEAIEKKDKLITMGLSRVKQFSWEKTARKTIKIYETLYKGQL